MPNYGSGTQTHFQVPTPKTPSPKVDFVARRKRERKLAERQHSRQQCIWFGGKLYFGNKYSTNPEEVPGAENIPKPGKSVVGWAGAHSRQGQPTQELPIGYKHPSDRYSVFCNNSHRNFLRKEAVTGKVMTCQTCNVKFVVG